MGIWEIIVLFQITEGRMGCMLLANDIEKEASHFKAVLLFYILTIPTNSRWIKDLQVKSKMTKALQMFL